VTHRLPEAVHPLNGSHREGDTAPVELIELRLEVGRLAHNPLDTPPAERDSRDRREALPQRRLCSHGAKSRSEPPCRFPQPRARRQTHGEEKALTPDVVHVAPQLFGRRGVWGGGTRYSLELARAIAREVPTRLVTFGSRREHLRAGALDIHVLKRRPYPRGDDENPLSELLPLEVADARVVHAHQYEALPATLAIVLARSVGGRAFATDLGGVGPRFARRLPLHRLVTGFLPLSHYAAGFYPELSDRTTVIYGGVDVARFRPGNPSRERMVVFVGRLMPHKGVHRLIEAIDPETPLHLFGRPYNREYVRDLRRLAHMKNVTFHESASDDEVVSAMRTARVAVLPSLVEHGYGGDAVKAELLGLTLLEAMACGTPVVCTDQCSMPEVVVDGETGLVVPPNDPEALRHAIRTLLDNDVRWTSMSGAAVEHVLQRFTWRRVAERCLAAYGVA
jgi:glycosyltransferase involved in cell wall biosynthesis